MIKSERKIIEVFLELYVINIKIQFYLNERKVRCKKWLVISLAIKIKITKKKKSKNDNGRSN